MSAARKIIDERERDKFIDALIEMSKYPDAGYHTACQQFQQQYGLSWSMAERQREDERKKGRV